MARILIIGCGCRGSALAQALLGRGHVVRGTTRRPSAIAAIEAAGAEGVVADPDRLATMMDPLDGAGAVIWLMGSASGAPDALAALHGPRLESMLELIVDTHARGLVYEAAGSVGSSLTETGRAIVRRARATYRMPVEVAAIDPVPHGPWLAAMLAATEAVLAA